MLDKSAAIRSTPILTRHPNYKGVVDAAIDVTVGPADGRNLRTVELVQKYTDTEEHTYAPDWSSLPEGQRWTFSSEASEVLPRQDFAADGSLLTYAIPEGKALGDQITITLKASCANYEDFTITLHILLREKDDQAALRVTGGTTVVYGETLQLGSSGGSGTGKAAYAVTNGTGEAVIDPDTGASHAGEGGHRYRDGHQGGGQGLQGGCQ